ncbi:pre-mRNA-processing factor 17 [Branchiostoma belcheri]|nr:pre-mRNA-processing factor 17 [Branchiostoma belcheri]
MSRSTDFEHSLSPPPSPRVLTPTDDLVQSGYFHWTRKYVKVSYLQDNQGDLQECDSRLTLITAFLGEFLVLKVAASVLLRLILCKGDRDTCPPGTLERGKEGDWVSRIPCGDLRPMPPIGGNQNEASPWRLCYDHAHGGALGNPQAEECVVYSFSLERKDPFALALAHTGCEVHVFDPDLEGEEHQQVGDELWVHRAALDWRDSHHEGEGGRWHTRRFTSIMRDLGHNTVDVVRMDLEGLEWKVLEDMLLEGAMSRIHQLLVEVHLHWSGFQVMGSPPQVVRYWYSLFHQLHNQNYRLVGMYNHDLVPNTDSLNPGHNTVRTFNQHYFKETDVERVGSQVELQVRESGPGRPKRLSTGRFLQDTHLDVGCCHVLVWINTHWENS